jgi:hypothetical protein
VADTGTGGEIVKNDAETREETWVFLGSRVNTKRARVHVWAWIDDDDPDREMLFSAKGHYTIGGNYKVKVSRADGITMHGTPTYLEPNPDTDLRARAAASHRAAEITLSRFALERSQNRKDPLDEALSPLIELAKTVPPSQRDAFSLYVLRSLLRAW